jgi:hypothetical protein
MDRREHGYALTSNCLSEDTPTIQIHKKRNIFYPPALRNSGIKIKGRVMKSLVIPILQSQLLFMDTLQFNAETPYSTHTHVICTTNFSTWVALYTLPSLPHTRLHV